jgi:thermostable 8-oxoguanine DNA glycosylase
MRVERSGDEWDEAERIKAYFRELKLQRRPLFLTREELIPVLSYKLRSQEARTAQPRRAWSEQLIPAITRATFSVELSDREEEAYVRIGVLSALPGVGVPVASAILAFVDPDRYAIIDVRVWQQIFDTERRSFAPREYVVYMRELWKLSEQLGLSPQVVDWCLWHRS